MLEDVAEALEEGDREKAEAVLKPSAIFASNTSTIPITSLAAVTVGPKGELLAAVPAGGVRAGEPREEVAERERAEEASRAAEVLGVDHDSNAAEGPVGADPGNGRPRSRARRHDEGSSPS